MVVVMGMAFGSEAPHLREMYANLLATAMHSPPASRVPSLVCGQGDQSVICLDGEYHVNARQLSSECHSTRAAKKINADHSVMPASGRATRLGN